MVVIIKSGADNSAFKGFDFHYTATIIKWPHRGYPHTLILLIFLPDVPPLLPLMNPNYLKNRMDRPNWLAKLNT